MIARNRDPSACESAAREINAPWSFRLQGAKERALSLNPEWSLTKEGIQFWASLLGSSIERLPALVRIDSRPPNDISINGFVPRSDKQPGTIFDHIARKGSSSFVSASLGCGNKLVCMMLAVHDYLPILSENNFARLRKSSEPFIVKYLAESQGKSPGETHLLRNQIDEEATAILNDRVGRASRTMQAFEYAIAGVEGIKVPRTLRDYPHHLEDEVAALAIPPQSIVGCRQITITDYWDGLHLKYRTPIQIGLDVRFGDWTSLDGGPLDQRAWDTITELRYRDLARRAAGFSWQDYLTGRFTPEKHDGMIEALTRGDDSFEANRAAHSPDLTL